MTEPRPDRTEPAQARASRGAAGRPFRNIARGHTSSTSAAKPEGGSKSTKALKSAKAELRASMRTAVQRIKPFARARRAQALAAAVLRSPALAGVRLVLAYRALADEIDVDPLVRALVARGVRVAFPHVDSRGELLLVEIVTTDPLAPEHWTRDRYGIAAPRLDAAGSAAAVRVLAPLDLDAVIVPGRAFDARGGRLGRGKGFYDDLLPHLRPDARRATVGACFREQLVDCVPEEPHDRRLGFVAAEGKLLRGAPRRSHAVAPEIGSADAEPPADSADPAAPR